MGRRVVLFFLGSAVAAACGIDESGLMGDASMDATSTDGNVAANGFDTGPMDVQIDVPTACSTLDATACVDASLPPGWTYAVASPGDVPCPVGDYEEKSVYATAPVPNAGACLTGCDAGGAYSCAGQVQAGSMGQCGGNLVVFDAGNVPVCVDTGWSDFHIGIGFPPAVSNGGATCSVTDIGNHSFDRDRRHGLHAWLLCRLPLRRCQLPAVHRVDHLVTCVANLPGALCEPSRARRKRERHGKLCRRDVHGCSKRRVHGDRDA